MRRRAISYFYSSINILLIRDPQLLGKKARYKPVNECRNTGSSNVSYCLQSFFLGFITVRMRCGMN
ncbi:hypothetical protein D3C78_1393740 [compost metagenome]